MDLRDFFDPYERKARIYPALIILFPAFIATYCLFSDLRDLLSTVIGSVFFVGISYFLGKMSREIGKKKQEKLKMKWDGMPTLRFLRHRDETIDDYTKARYHKYLESHVPNLKLPTQQEELADPQKADLIYESAIKWLLNKTRDTQKYSLLFSENISYGFARNFWSMKVWGIAINLLVLTATIFLIDNRYSFDLTIVPVEVWLSVTVTIIILIFTIFFREVNVHSKAKAYARTLLEVCDEQEENNTTERSISI
ncbi:MULTISPECIES: hypothetical protein [unclassified Brevibacillus]|uniref:hypothetical protein n=1 Tax=Brevibacillus TaxID=55080 RepID=UPI000EE0F504|nr:MULTISPECIES: hypothetical protein [unclassified Brevibacillus]UED69807.1 hypothetical protein HP435_03930 [Brevibacillus sp. HD3.3A]HBZ82211.1 hypothetical protein [Brevibacillus sp.]